MKEKKSKPQHMPLNQLGRSIDKHACGGKLTSTKPIKIDQAKEKYNFKLKKVNK